MTQARSQGEGKGRGRGGEGGAGLDEGQFFLFFFKGGNMPQPNI